MLSKLALLFKIPELRQKILITLLFLAIYRVGFQIPLSILDQSALQKWTSDIAGGTFGRLMGVVSIFSASNIGMSTVFGLGIMPYISASIIFQLLGSVYPPLEKLQKEGESGRKKINEYTRYATVVLCFGQSYMWIYYLMYSAGTQLVPPEYHTFFYHLQAAVTMTCGTVFLMWIGEQIDEYGIGNGISLLIMAGIVARMPRALYQLISNASLQLGGSGGRYNLETIVVLAIVFVGVVLAVVAITLGQRRIPTQSAKHVRGRRVYGGGRQYLPLRVNQAGVMPIIFASSLLMFPNLIFGWLASALDWSVFVSLHNLFTMGAGYLYNVLYIILIYFFCYFWTAITFKPKDMADNLKDFGSFIPGYRPGKRTADYLERVMVRITYVGAAFLAIVAVVPTLISSAMAIDYMIASFYGGTGLLIVVSVALDLVQKIDSHLVMRNYSGLMDRG